MARELLILRHEKSDWDAGAHDYHRPLTNRCVKSSQMNAMTWCPLCLYFLSKFVFIYCRERCYDLEFCGGGFVWCQRSNCIG